MGKRVISKAPVQQRPRRDRAVLLAILAVGTLAVLAYVDALGNDFVLDDIRLIRDNVRIRSLSDIPVLFGTSYWGVEGAQALYRPLVLATYALDYAVHGLSPSGYIAVNIALHTLVSVLIWALVRELGGSLLAATVAGMLFAVHPVHTEAVAGISGRPELLAGGFFLGALLLHRRALRSANRSGWLRVAATTCFALALLSKESAMTLLLVVPVMNTLVPPLRRWRVTADYLPMLAVAGAYVAVRRAVLGGIVIAGSAIAPLDNPLVPMATMPLGERIGTTGGQAWMTAVAVFVQYARLVVWPWRLSPDYSYDQIPLVTSAADLRFVCGVVLAVACVAATVVLWRRAPIAAFGLAFSVLTFSIVSNVVITIGTICAERLVYLPSAGVVIAAGIGLQRLATDQRRRPIVFAAIGVVLVLATVRTAARNREWADEATLWTSAVAVAPNSARVQSEYGRILMARADAAAAQHGADADRLYADAAAHYHRALQIYPSYSLPLDGLAMIASLHGQFDEAATLYGRAMTAWPGNYASLTNWASMLWDRARQVGAAAMKLRRDGQIAESDALVRQADAGFAEAREKVDRAVRMAPDYAQAHLVRAMILDGYAGDREGAIAEFETVLRLEPNHPQRAVIESELQRLRAR